MNDEITQTNPLDAIELTRVLLTSSNISLREEPQPDDKLGYTLSLSGDVNLDTEQGGATVDMTVELVVLVERHSSEDEPLELASIVFTLRSHYLAGDGQKIEEVSDDAVRKFAADKAFPDLDPFVKEFIQSMTGRLGFPPLIVQMGKVEAEVSRNE